MIAAFPNFRYYQRLAFRYIIRDEYNGDWRLIPHVYHMLQYRHSAEEIIYWQPATLKVLRWKGETERGQVFLFLWEDTLLENWELMRRFLGFIDREQSPVFPNSVTIGHACYVVGNSLVFILGVFSLILRWE